MDPPEAKGDRYLALAMHLGILASQTRLRLLHALRTPLPLHEIRVGASLTREGEQSGRMLSRQAVTHHLEQLMSAGLVARTRDAKGRDAYVLDHPHVFALVDEIRSLSRLRPLADVAPSGATLSHAAAGPPVLPPGPRLVVAYGRDDGVAFSLAGDQEAWRVGRDAACEVRLDYDPYLSSVHAVVRSDGSAFEVQDAGSRNGTALNWQRLRPGATMPLSAGDVLNVGRSLLVFQA